MDNGDRGSRSTGEMRDALDIGLTGLINGDTGVSPWRSSSANVGRLTADADAMGLRENSCNLPIGEGTLVVATLNRGRAVGTTKFGGGGGAGIAEWARRCVGRVGVVLVLVDGRR